MAWFVYIVECNDGTFYTGIAKDVHKRIGVHNDGKGAKYTAARRPVRLLDYVQVETRSDALKLEIRVKRQPKDKKLQVLRG